MKGRSSPFPFAIRSSDCRKEPDHKKEGIQRNAVTQLEKFSVLCTDTNYHQNLSIAKATRTCVMCHNTATFFRDLPAKVEYEISALCQDCQDELFKRP